MSTDSQTTRKTYDVFISHKSYCKPWVEVLAQNLQNRGYSVFLDIWEIVPAKSIVDELYRGLRQSCRGILVVTPEAFESGWVREEYNQMMVQKQENPDFTIIPVILGKEVPDFPFLQNILWIDFRHPNTYREAFYRLICAIENRAPGAEIELEGELIMPPELGEKTAQPPNQGEIAFVEDLFELFYTRQAVLLFAQADRGQSAMKSYLLKQAEEQFGKDNVLYLVPPYSPHADTEDYFSALGKQCDFSESITSAVALMNAFEEKLVGGKRLFILVSGFENSGENGQVELAGVFRGLNERYDNFRILICGGEKLSDLYYTGTLSYLNMAEVREWPEMTVADVHFMKAQLYPNLTISDETAEEMLEVSGGHPRLLQQCLSFCRSGAGFDANACRDALIQSPFVWQLFTPFAQDAAATQHLCQLLGQDEVSPAQPYLFDSLLRRLYWKNLLKRCRGGRWLAWRCGTLRVAGRQILGC